MIPTTSSDSIPAPSAPSELTAADAAVMETFVVPRYLRLYGELLQQMLLAGEASRIVHLGCRTGYPDRQLCERLPNATVVGVDRSAFALELARNKAKVSGEGRIEYHQVSELSTRLPDAAFSHAITLHPIVSTEERFRLLHEAARLIYPGGQVLMALPLRGSYQEVGDLLREFALKYDDAGFGTAVDLAMATRPTIETLSEEIEAVGLEDVDVEIRQTTLTFDNGRSLFEDPITRLLVVPELRAGIGVQDLGRAMAYVRDSIDKYWAESKFELSVNVGCASARRY